MFRPPQGYPATSATGTSGRRPLSCTRFLATRVVAVREGTWENSEAAAKQPCVFRDKEMAKQPVKGIAFLCDASPKARMDAAGRMNLSARRFPCFPSVLPVSFVSEQLRSGSQS